MGCYEDDYLVVTEAVYLVDQLAVGKVAELGRRADPVSVEKTVGLKARGLANM